MAQSRLTSTAFLSALGGGVGQHVEVAGDVHLPGRADGELVGDELLDDLHEVVDLGAVAAGQVLG